MFIQTEDTPNPATMKFLPSRSVCQSPLEMTSREEAAVSPLATALFDIEGVKSVFLGTDFISVTKEPSVEWPVLRPAVLSCIMEHYTHDRPILTDAPQGEPGVAPSCPEHNASDEEIVRQICDLLDMRIRPAVAQDGGDVAFERYEDGIVYLRLKGACAGCPSATATLKFGIEQMLRHFIPEVQEVRRVI